MFAKLSYTAQKRLLVFSFLAIPLALLVTFSFYPAVKLIYYSFTSWDGISHDVPWVGFRNYLAVFKNPQIFGVFQHNLMYFVGGIVQNIIALYFAILLSSKIRGRNVFRVILFLPYILNTVAVSYMFQFVFQDQGTLNLLLKSIGLGSWAQSWIGNAHIVNWSLAFVSLWQFMGFNMVIYLAAIQAIPQDMYEASTLDGAGPWQTFFFVTLPNLRAIIQVNMLLTVGGALESFNLPFIMTNASPATETFVTKTQEVAFTFNNFGLASAMAVVLLIIVFIVLTAQQKLLGGGRDVV